MTEPTTADPQALSTEYVVGGGFWWYQGAHSRALALPWAIDDVSRDFGDDLYDRMDDDSAVASVDLLYRAGVLEDGVTLSPAVDDQAADGYDLAVELVGFCEQNLEELETPLDDTLWDVAGCMGRGNRVSEIVYHDFDQSPLPGRAVLQNLVVKPRESTAFVVSPYMRTLGLMGKQDGTSISVQPGALIAPDDPRILPREKFMVATFRPKNNDPRGTSAYRPAYNPWWLKMQTWQEYLKYLAQFASPLAVGKTPVGAKVAIDPTTGASIRAVDALLASLLQIRNGSALALEGGSEFALFFSTGEGRAFLSAIELYNREIRMAITTQTLASGEGEHASRAQASVHQDALDTLLRQAKRSLCRCLRRDVLRNLVRYNYGDAAAKLTPQVSLGEVQVEDLAKIWMALSQLGLTLDPSQYAQIDRRYNLPPRQIAPAPTPGGAA